MYVCIIFLKQSKSNVQDAFFKNSHQIQHSLAKYLNILALETACASAPGEILAQTITAFSGCSR